LKQSVTDVLRHGLDSTLANWQLIAIRIAENILFIMIVVAAVIAAVVPIAVAAGISNFDVKASANPGEAIAAMIVEHWMLIFYILAIATVILVLLIAIHSFVEAGNARVFIDAERVAARRAFSIDRWMQGGRASWWAVFWIYNIAWGVGGLVMIVPLLATLAGMLAVSDAGPRVVIGCLGLFIFVLVTIPLAIIIAIWTQKAITIAVGRAAAANTALRAGWAAIRTDFGRHFAVAFIVFVIAFGGAMAISMLTAPMSLVSGATRAPFVNIAFAPAQILSSILQSVFSAAVGLWFLATYVGLTEE
jgi:hypothetical protein